MMNNQKYCKKLVYQDETLRNHILLGIVLESDNFFIRFKTRNREMWVSKNSIISITDTTQKFEGDAE
jgi:hypothetical protein